MKRPELQDIFSDIKEIAYKAGWHIKSRYQSGDSTVIEKHRHDVKLDVDRDVEELILNMIKQKYPDHGFICEEGGIKNNDSATYTWIIDPLDGTVNFSWGIPHFCTSIALKDKDKTLAAVIYDPILDEMFSAARGMGVFLNNRKIPKREVTKLEDAIIAGGFFKKGAIENSKHILINLFSRIKKIRFFGSAALDLSYLSLGRFNGFVQKGLNEWDIAAAALIVELAGKSIKIIEEHGGLTVIAADKPIFKALLEILEYS